MSRNLIESLRSIVDDEKSVSPMDYSMLICQIASQNQMTEECLNDLRNMRCMLNRNGEFIYPHQAMMSNTESYHDDRILDTTLNQQIYKYKHREIRWLLKLIGVGELVSTTIDGITYNILINSQEKTICIVGNDLKEINRINISAHWLRHDQYFSTGEISLVFIPLTDYYNHNESEFVKATLSIFEIEYNAIINMNTGQIVVPFMIDDGILDTTNNRIIFYKTIYSTEGKRLFPNENYPNDDLTIIKKSKTGICIAKNDISHNYFIIQKDYTVRPLDNKIYSFDPNYRRGDIDFEIWGNGMIKAIETFKDSVCYSIIPELTRQSLLDSEGNFILSSDTILYDRTNNRIITK